MNSIIYYGTNSRLFPGNIVDYLNNTGCYMSLSVMLQASLQVVSLSNQHMIKKVHVELCYRKSLKCNITCLLHKYLIANQSNVLDCMCTHIIYVQAGTATMILGSSTYVQYRWPLLLVHYDTF